MQKVKSIKRENIKIERILVTDPSIISIAGDMLITTLIDLGTIDHLLSS